MTEGDVTPGLSAVAVPFTSPMGGTPLALGVGGPIARIRRKKPAILEALGDFVASFDAHARASRGPGSEL